MQTVDIKVLFEALPCKKHLSARPVYRGSIPFSAKGSKINEEVSIMGNGEIDEVGKVEVSEGDPGTPQEQLDRASGQTPPEAVTPVEEPEVIGSDDAVPCEGNSEESEEKPKDEEADGPDQG